jgi:hypothetical protein
MACYSFCVRKETIIILVESLIDHSLFLRVKLCPVCLLKNNFFLESEFRGK